MKECSTVSFKGQVIYCGIDVHKKSWHVTIRHCCHQIENFSMNPDPVELANHLKRNYPEAEYRSVYEAGFSGYEAHRTLCCLGVKNIVINPADVPTSGKEREYKTTVPTVVSWHGNWRMAAWKEFIFRSRKIWS